MSRRFLPLTAAVVALATVTAEAPAARSVAYKGKAAGSSLTFTLRGGRVSAIRTVVPTVCVETTGSGQTRAGGELFRPPGALRLGGERRAKALQPAALNAGTKATKNYRVTVRRGRGRALTGRLRVSYSFLRLDLYRSLPYTFLCQGSARFTARPR